MSKDVQEVRKHLDLMDPHHAVNNHQIELVLMAIRALSEHTLEPLTLAYGADVAAVLDADPDTLTLYVDGEVRATSPVEIKVNRLAQEA